MSERTCPSLSRPSLPFPSRSTVSTWRKVVAAILDFIFILVIAGYAIGSLTGNTTERGFELKGGPALIVVRDRHPLFHCLHAISRRHGVPAPARRALSGYSQAARPGSLGPQSLCRMTFFTIG